MAHQMPKASKPIRWLSASDTTGLKKSIRRIPEGMPACARACTRPVSRKGDRLGLLFGWHPFGMRTRRKVTGGVAALNHLTAENPPGSGNASYQLSMITGVPPPRRGRPLAAHGNAVGLIRFKTLSPTRGAPSGCHSFGGTGHVRVPFQGGFFFGDSFPMALPWAGRKVPLTGRQTWRKSAPIFCTRRNDCFTGHRSLRI